MLCRMETSSFEEIARTLLHVTKSDRVTIRVQVPGLGFPVIAEAVSKGTRRIMGEPVGDLMSAPSVIAMVGSRRPLVQSDFGQVEAPPPAELMQRFGFRAQILVPIFAMENLAGILSVHASNPRGWSPLHLCASECTAELIGQLLGCGTVD